MRARLEPRADGDRRAKPGHIYWGARRTQKQASQRGRRDGLGVQEVGFSQKKKKNE